VVRIVLYLHGLQDLQTSLLATSSCGDTSCSATTLDDLTERINSVDRDMLQRVWEEFSYRLDVVHAAGGGHIERVKYMCLGTTDC
jgi:hypothetical protein